MTMNMRMNAAVLTGFGGPEVLQMREVERPTPREDQMLVRVGACGICGHDLLNRQGHFPDTHPPSVMGHEIAGEVVMVGRLVEGFRAGDRVALTQRMSCGVCPTCRAGRDNLCRHGAGFYGESTTGGYGQYVVASPRNAVHLPASLGFDVGAILSCALGTGFHALQRARLMPGDTVLITGASGGVGLHTVEIARLLGLRVIGIVGTAGKAASVKEAGAHEVLTAGEEPFHKEVRKLTEGQGVDAVIEIAGAPTFRSSTSSLAAGGRLVAVGNVAPGTVPFNPALAILKEIEIVGSSHALVSDLKRLVQLVERGVLKPRIAARFPLAQAADAHLALEGRGASGRMVLMHE